MALLRNILNARQSPGLRVNYQIAQLYNSISFPNSQGKMPDASVWADTGFFIMSAVQDNIPTANTQSKEQNNEH